MSRLLFDLTDLEAWSGVHGGTQRVVYGIAKELYVSNRKDLVFVAFSPKHNKFYITSLEPILQRVESTNLASPALSEISLEEKIRRKVAPYTPKFIKNNKKLKQIALQSVGAGLCRFRLIRQIPNKLKTNNVQLKAIDEVKIHSDDTILILGKPWDYPLIQNFLSSEKNITNFKIVQLVYDLIISLNPQLHHPALFKVYTQNMFEAISNSDMLLAISKSTADDLKIFAEKLNMTLPKVKTIRLGDEISDTIQPSDKPDSRIEDEYIACIGTIEIRKNHTLLYYCYKLAQEKGIELPQLVIVGSPGWMTEDIQYLINNDPTVKPKIIILNNISDAALIWIYKNCLFTVYPSLYEGWGLPVAESLAYGKLCIASNSSSIPEIAEEMIDYFSPYDANECLGLIIKYLDTKTLKNKVKIIKSYKTTTWKDTTIQVEEAINSIAQ